MRKAIINDNGVVTNIIELSDPPEIPAGTPEDEATALIARYTWTPPDGMTAVDALEAVIGDTWNGTQFVPSQLPAPVPQVVSRQQIMAAMMLAGLITEPEWLTCYQDGTLPALVQAAIDTLPDAASKLVAKVKWVEFSEARRDDALVGLLQAQAGLSDTQLDDLFKTASSL